LFLDLQCCHSVRLLGARWPFWIAAPVWRSSYVVVSRSDHKYGQRDKNLQSGRKDLSNFTG
jgi:hypothetical protein